MVAKDFAFADELYDQAEPNPEELYEAAVRGGIESIRWCQNRSLPFASRELYMRLVVIPGLHRYAISRNHIAMLDYLWKEYPKEYWEKLPLETGKRALFHMKDIDEVLAYKRTRRWLRRRR